jgi:hydrogenase nickel incorporation protein HypB
MVQEALGALDLRGLDLLFVENVGNLVCPAAYDLGEHVRLVLLATTEGEDKPIKYPALFRKADALVLTKVDLLPHLACDADQAVAFARQVNPGLAVFRTSATTGEGLGALAGWILERARAGGSRRAPAPRPAARAARSGNTR